MTFRPGWFAPDHEGHDAHMDAIACPDIHGTEPAGRPLTFNRRARSVDPAPATRPPRMGIHAAETSAPVPSSPPRAGAEPSSDTRQPSGGHRSAA